MTLNELLESHVRRVMAPAALLGLVQGALVFGVGIGLAEQMHVHLDGFYKLAVYVGMPLFCKDEGGNDVLRGVEEEADKNKIFFSRIEVNKEFITGEAEAGEPL